MCEYRLVLTRDIYHTLVFLFVHNKVNEIATEIVILKQCQHLEFLAPHDVLNLDGHIGVIMELKGRSLDKYVRSAGGRSQVPGVCKVAI